MTCRIEDCTLDAIVTIIYRDEVADYCVPHAVELVQTDPLWVALASHPSSYGVAS